MSPYFSGASARVSALRAHTSTLPMGFAVAGVHMALVAGLQSCSIVHPVAAPYTHHLNCTGAAPPVAAAVSVIVVPACCGAARSAVTLTAVISGRIAYGRSAYCSGASASDPALRAHTSTMPTTFAVAGVHMPLAALLPSSSTVRPAALYTHHLNCTGAALPVAAAVSVIVVPGGCGAARSAVTVTAVTGPSA